jgi:ribokinase
MTGTIAVVGSLNMDLVTRVAVAPGPGVTVMGSDLRNTPGGKALNQAGAAGLLGRSSRTWMVGRVGDDAYGAQLRESLKAAKVNVEEVRVTAGCPSGVVASDGRVQQARAGAEGPGH